MGVTVDMKYLGCSECGALYGYPDDYKYDHCPFCMKRQNSSLSAIIYEKDIELSNLNNTIRGLRGTITRIKNNILKKGLA